MSQAALQQVLVHLEALEPQELEQVSRAVQERLTPSLTTDRRQAFYRALVTSGLVKRIRTRAPGQGTERELVQVRGKPVSQTIIEERR